MPDGGPSVPDGEQVAGGQRAAVLTPWRATSLMLGAGVGAGIMAVPLLASRTGATTLVLVVAVALAATTLIHLMLAEVAFRTDRDLQVVELMRLHLFRGRWQVVFQAAFGLLSLAFVAILAAYVAGGSEIVTSLTGWPQLVGDGLVYAASAVVALFGLRGVGAAERLGAGALVAVVAVLALLALLSPGGPAGFAGLPWGPTGSVTDALALFGMVMYALFTFYTVPQVVQGLAPDQRSAARAVTLGLAANGALVVVLALVALAVSDPVTDVASVGIAEAVGGIAGTLGSVFVLVALLTSYWSVSLALADVLRERLDLRRKPAWLAATLPSLVLLEVGGWRFLEWLSLAGGATALVVVLVTVPMYAHARRTGRRGVWSLGRWGGAPGRMLVLVAAALMAVGSLLAA